MRPFQIVDAQMVSGTPTLRAARPLLLGYNYPWAFNKYGLYFGPHLGNPTLPLPAPTIPTSDVDFAAAATVTLAGEDTAIEAWVDAFGSHIKFLRTKLKISVVRLFLLCNGMNWGGVDATGRFTPPPYLHLRFRYHMRRALQACQDAGVQLLPSLVDFGIGNPKAPMERRLPIVTDPTMRSTFYDQVLEPLLTDSEKFKSSIYAWEVMNEPSWLTGHFWPDISWDKPFSWIPMTPLATEAQISAFLSDGIARIEKHGFASTVGHRFFDDMTTFPSGSKPQFHFYPTSLNSDPSVLPDATKTGLKTPPILGEFGSTSYHGGGWNEVNGRDIGGTAQRVSERFKAIDAKNYSLGILWPDQADPQDHTVDPLKLSSEAEQGILLYLSTR